MTAFCRDAVRRLRRAPFLVVMGLGWLGYGRGIMTDPRYGTSRGLASITRYVPMGTLAWLWVGCGLLAVLAGLLYRHVGELGQAAGFTALVVPATTWACAFTTAWTAGGYPSASGSAAAWTAFAIGILLVSGMVDPPLRRERG
jgi:hypothetical protein